MYSAMAVGLQLPNEVHSSGLKFSRDGVRYFPQPVVDMQTVVQELHGRPGAVACQRQKRTGLLRKVIWTLYDGKNFENLVKQITGFVNKLENLFSMQTTRQRLVV
ncbi:Heterokaryon incompatibility protein S [Fusarium oxysporum f. sp. rapae]|uniref:Heterokaryon incompatibility protein S n=1 Tax=Fusarium oxysporum f. sp. rapae TaxID=485398 RepID=A0A8J5NIN3_FUSOX|nr:Heterokaryon incompatibility protein S [Fusarium oxysporum f. sp. rapae]